MILTGSYATAQPFLAWRPDLRLHAETSGKNSIVITATADIDRAVMDLVRSAFGHAGQKCSAASLAIVEAPLYDDPAFLERVRDAAASLRVGPASDVATEIGPLIDPPGEVLQRALTTLDPGEQWLLDPRLAPKIGRLWSPGIRIGVRPGSWFARDRVLRPRARHHPRRRPRPRRSRSRTTATTASPPDLHSLDPDEIAQWRERVEAGNLYVNRGITGAIVRRQPFGGWKRSAVGPTAKAGGPSYVNTLARWHDTGLGIETVAADYRRWMREVGHREHDPSALAAEGNVLRYRALSAAVLVRWGSNATDRERGLVVAASSATGAHTVCSDAADESAAALAARLGTLGVGRLRLIGDDADTATHELRVCCPCRRGVGRRRATRGCSRDRATEVAARAVCDHDDASPRPTPARPGEEMTHDDFPRGRHSRRMTRRTPVEYNYRDQAQLEADNVAWREWSGEQPGMSAFAREGNAVFHTYSAYARGLDALWPMWQWLDRAPLGRNERDLSWFHRHDEYSTSPAVDG